MKIAILILFTTLIPCKIELSTNFLSSELQKNNIKKVINLNKKNITFKKSNIKNSLENDNKLIFISSNISSSIFSTGIEHGLSQNTVMRLINIYRNTGINFKKDILPGSRLDVLFERINHDNNKIKEKILYTSLTINKKITQLYYYKLKNGQEGYFNKIGINLLNNRKDFINPLNGNYLISSKFGSRKHPIRGKIIFHKGIDYAANFGTPIHATAEGIIEYIGNNGGYGKYIKIKHNNGYSTCYGHISKFNNNIKLGSKVKQGQIIAYVGKTGIATGPHLHYEIIYNGKHIDPLTIEHKNKIILLDNELIEFKFLVKKIDKKINTKNLSKNDLQKDNDKNCNK